MTTVIGTVVEVRQSDTWTFTITLDDNGLTGYDDGIFAVKLYESQEDSASLLLVRTDTGLVYIDGDAPADTANGTLTIVSDTQFTVSIALAETDITPVSGYKWYLKMLTSTTAVTIESGQFSIIGSGIDATS